ncbi:MAG: NAD(P)/FAD-dependent oxidoreductase [Planctomycetota bacterium]
MKDADTHTTVIGGGPAGLTAAYELLKLAPGCAPLVLEASGQVGGIARTEVYKGYRFDIGGHRFFTKVDEVNALWDEILTDDFLMRPRSSRIFYRNKFYDYPLRVGNALKNIGVLEAARIALSYARWKALPHRTEENFEQWVVNRFGRRLYEHFFKSYTEKVWGIPCTEIRADWAAQRIKNLSLRKAIVNALTGQNDTSSLITQFKYPRLGPGMMWERCRDIIRDGGGEVRMNTAASRILRDGSRVTGVETASADGSGATVTCDHLVSTMPLSSLVRRMDPPAPDAVLEAANRLKYRDFLIVTLILDHPDPFSDNWIYVHSPDVKVGRIQNFRSWSEAMVPDPNRSSIGMEYFCHEGDGLWASENEELIAQATDELDRLGLAPRSSVIDGTVIRQPKAYPVYDEHYRTAVGCIAEWTTTIANLYPVGRNGMHRYNNQDHSMLTAMLAARNILGDEHDLWNVNVERSYHEDFVTDRKNATRA